MTPATRIITVTTDENQLVSTMFSFTFADKLLYQSPTRFKSSKHALPCSVEGRGVRGVCGSSRDVARLGSAGTWSRTAAAESHTRAVYKGVIHIRQGFMLHIPPLGPRSGLEAMETVPAALAQVGSLNRWLTFAVC